MPTQAKIEKVGDLTDKLSRCSIAITANYNGMSGEDMTQLRRRMRETGLDLLVVKNTLLNLAADEANKPQLKTVVEGPTAVAFAYGDPVDAARVILDYVRTTRVPLNVRGAVLGVSPALDQEGLTQLSTLPSKEQLLANLLGQLQAPISRLFNVLNGPGWGLQNLLQARIRQLEGGETAAA